MTLAPEYTPKSWGRKGHRWRVVREQAFQRDMKRNAPCWICGRPIDYTLPPSDPWGWQPDHVLSVKEHPELANDIGNIRPSHARCNNQRGQEEKAKRRHDHDLGQPSEDWGI